MKFSGLAALGAAAAFGLAGCGTITQGTTQEIAVSSAPSGAHCTMTRNGILIAKVKKTPESVKVNKRKYAILLNCEHDGYQPASLTLESGCTTLTDVDFGAAVRPVLRALAQPTGARLR